MLYIYILSFIALYYIIYIIIDDNILSFESIFIFIIIYYIIKKCIYYCKIIKWNIIIILIL